MKKAFLILLVLALSACTIPRHEENKACTARGGVEVVILSGDGHVCAKLERL